MENWFTIDTIDPDTAILSEYRHWEETHCYLLTGTERALLIDTGLGICDISQHERQVKFVLSDFSAEAIASLVTGAKYRRRLVVNAGEIPSLTLTLQHKEKVLETSLAMVEDLLLAIESGEGKGEE